MIVFKLRLNFLLNVILEIRTVDLAELGHLFSTTQEEQQPVQVFNIFFYFYL